MAPKVKKLAPVMNPELEAVALVINRACFCLSDKERTFKLSAPASLTLRTYNHDKTWGYKHQAFIGDEEFLITEAYIGKSGKAICVLLQEGFKSLTVEIPFNQCHTKLTGFSKFISLASELSEDASMDEAKAVAVEKERLAHVEAQRGRQIENPNFGSW